MRLLIAVMAGFVFVFCFLEGIDGFGTFLALELEKVAVTSPPGAMVILPRFLSIESGIKLSKKLKVLLKRIIISIVMIIITSGCAQGLIPVLAASCRDGSDLERNFA